ncbi:hypothetical protein AB0M35_04140 [Micromonospora sp. NPDC051196]|uniref:hypothetical protein n=1 Tax=Micromonospora sp. NPDC051196 TaxID=3155281 RepID=UPI003433F9EB
MTAHDHDPSSLAGDRQSHEPAPSSIPTGTAEKNDIRLLPARQSVARREFTRVSSAEIKAIVAASRLLARHEKTIKSVMSASGAVARVAEIANQPTAMQAMEIAAAPATSRAVEIATAPAAMRAVEVAREQLTSPATNVLASIQNGPQFTFALSSSAQIHSLVAGMTSQLATMADVMPSLTALEAFRTQNYLQVMSRTRDLWSMPDVLGDLFRDWRRIAELQGPDRTMASQAYAAALRTRETILRKPDSQAAVVEFGMMWLGFRSMPQTRIDATVAALLDDDWLDTNETDFPTVMRLRVNEQHEVHRPIWERQIKGRLIDSLDKPVLLNPMAEPFPLIDVIPGVEAVEQQVLADVGGWDDPRIGRVLSRLNDDERAVAAAFAQNPDASWRVAARMSGRDEQFGMRVQRKLKREGERISARLTAAGAGDHRG